MSKLNKPSILIASLSAVFLASCGGGASNNAEDSGVAAPVSSLAETTSLPPQTITSPSETTPPSAPLDVIAPDTQFRAQIGGDSCVYIDSDDTPELFSTGLAGLDSVCLEVERGTE